MKVLVTGGAGYLGSILLQALLDRGHSVRVIDNLSVGSPVLLHVAGHDAFSFVSGDIRNRQALEPVLSGMGAVIHLAAVMGDSACQKQPDVAWEVNLEATRSLVETSRELGVSRFLFASTASNYGTSSPMEPATESTPLKPLSLYAETKVRAEEAVMQRGSHRFARTVFRLATLMGLSPAMRFDVLLNHFVRDAVVERRIDLYGPGAWRPFVHVRDAAKAIATWLEAPANLVAGEVFNIGQGNYRKIDLAEMVSRHVGEVEIVTTEASDLRDYCVSFEKSERVLGTKAELGPERAVLEIADAIRQGLLKVPNSV